MVPHGDLRERIRKNKIAVNQIYNYLDSLQDDNEAQQENIKKIRQNIIDSKSGKDDARKA